MMKDIPKEIDLYDWYDYSFFRAVLGLPIPSPKVWDNAGRFGFTGGTYLKDSFFEPDFFEPSLYTKEKLTGYIKEKYGNKLRLEKGKGKLMKSDKSNHKFVRDSDNNHLYLNFESFRKVKSLSDENNYPKIYEAIGEIYSLTQIIFEEFNLHQGISIIALKAIGYFFPLCRLVTGINALLTTYPFSANLLPFPPIGIKIIMITNLNF